MHVPEDTHCNDDWLDRQSTETIRCWIYKINQLIIKLNVVFYGGGTMNFAMWEASSKLCIIGLFNVKIKYSLMTSSNGNIFRVTGPLCWEFTGEFHHKSQRPGALMLSKQSGDLRRHRAHYDVTVMVHYFHMGLTLPRRQAARTSVTTAHVGAMSLLIHARIEIKPC